MYSPNYLLPPDKMPKTKFLAFIPIACLTSRLQVVPSRETASYTLYTPSDNMHII